MIADKETTRLIQSELDSKRKNNPEHKTPSKFSIYIETYALAHGLSIMDSLLAYCDEHDLEPDAIANKLTKSLKAKLLAEAEKNNFMKKRAPKALPIE